MEDWIWIIDVLAVPWTEIMNLRPRTGVEEVDSYFTECAPRVFTIGADILALIYTVIHVHNVMVPVIINGSPAHKDLSNEAVEVRDFVRLRPLAIAVWRSDRKERVNDPRPMVR